MRRSLVVVGLLVLGLAGPPAAAHEASAPSRTSEVTGGNAGSASGIEAVGHNALGWRGYNADVWVHDRHAYVGSWGFSDWSQGVERFCPAQDVAGVVVLDARDPSAPREVSRLRHPAGTSAEDVVVFTGRYGRATGRDIAVPGSRSAAARATTAASSAASRSGT